MLGPDGKPTDEPERAPKPVIHSAPVSREAPRFGGISAPNTFTEVDKAHREHVERTIGLGAPATPSPRFEDDPAVKSALNALGESAAQGARAAEQERQKQEMRARGETVRETINRSIEEVKKKSETGNVSDNEHHPTTKTLDYIALGIILAPAPEVISMYLRHENIDWQRVVISFVVSIAVGCAILWFAHGWRKTAGVLAAIRVRINRADDYFIVRAAIIAFFMIAPVLISPLISGASKPSQPGFTQEQVDTKIASTVSNLNSQLAEANRQRDAARREAENLREQTKNAPPQSSEPKDQIPVNWQTDFQMNWNGDQRIIWIRFIGASTELAHIKDAYIISTLTGHREHLDVANPTNFGERWKIDQIEPIPSGAQVILVYEPKPSPPLTDFIRQWGAFEFHVVYDNKEYVKAYSQNYINAKFAREMPGISGPRVTPRNDK